jgi:two-component system response regulator (stage 0 sporulation protein F)
MKRILYVDDEEMNLLLFETMFSKIGQIVTASNGNRALELLGEIEKPEVIISDMRMPGIDGLEFISRAHKILPDVDYYILSGFEISEKVENAIQEGLVKQYFQKPFIRQEIEAVIS